MPWMNIFGSKESSSPTDEPAKPVAPLQVTADDLINLPWTIELVGDTWVAPELGLRCGQAEDMDLQATTLIRDQYKRYHLGGPLPKLPTGMIWKDGKPARDPGEARERITRTFGGRR